MGFGVSSRSIEIDGKGYDDPLSQLFAGVEAKLGTKASIITEVAYKDSFTNDTPEKSAVDLTIRVDGHF